MDAYKVFALLLPVGAYWLTPALASSSCPNTLSQPTSSALYIENLGVHFTTRLVQTNVDSISTPLDDVTLMAGQLKPLVRSGHLVIDNVALLDLPNNSRIAASITTVSHIRRDLDIKSPLNLEMLEVASLDRREEHLQVIPKDKGLEDEKNRNKGIPAINLSGEEQRRRQLSPCNGSVFDDFVAASETVAKLPELNLRDNWAAVPNALARAGRLPASPSDPHYKTIKQFEQSYRTLIRACTRKDVPPAIASVVGKLTAGTEVCTAVRLGKRYIATSRHCLFNDEGNPRPVSPAEISFSYTNVDQPVPVCGIVRTKDASADFTRQSITENNDFIILVTTEQPDSAPVQAMDAAKVRIGANAPTELEVTGVWPGSGLLGLAGRDDLLTFTGALCQVVGPSSPQAAGCVLHRCGTIAGSSGAPLFLRTSLNASSKALQMLAINKGEADMFGTGSACRELANGVKANNIATIIPQEVIDELD